MTQVDAVFERGVFRPLAAVECEENARVRLRFEPLNSQTLPWLEEVRRIQQFILARTAGHLPDSTSDITADRER